MLSKLRNLQVRLEWDDIEEIAKESVAVFNQKVEEFQVLAKLHDNVDVLLSEIFTTIYDEESGESIYNYITDEFEEMARQEIDNLSNYLTKVLNEFKEKTGVKPMHSYQYTGSWDNEDDDSYFFICASDVLDFNEQGKKLADMSVTMELNL